MSDVHGSKGGLDVKTTGKNPGGLLGGSQGAPHLVQSKWKPAHPAAQANNMCKTGRWS